jgi:2-polyprenyl-3-methyl-5-hydroxy-6-metoxy-1,4-benzoquinol methylase
MLEEYGTVEWFEKYFKLSDDDPWGHNWRRIEQYRYDQVLKLIKKHTLNGTNSDNDHNILDIGCTTGDFTRRLYELNKNVIGIDISQTAIERAKSKFNYIDFRIDSLPKSSFQENTFDFITCLEVLYYMNRQTQKEFLSEMNNLLKKNGKALITSKIGGKPYFTSDELINLLSEHFEIKAVKYYGGKFYSRGEKLLFDKYQKANKIQRLLALSRNDWEKEFNTFDNLRKRIVISITCFVKEYKFLKVVTNAFLLVLKNIIKIILGWKFPAKFFHFMSEKLSLGRTHTFLVVGKSDE